MCGNIVNGGDCASRAFPSELRGLTWADFDGASLTVRRSVWNSTVNEPKTRRSKAPIPVVRQLSEALDLHKLRAGILAQPDLPIFQAGNGKPLNLDNMARRVISPVVQWQAGTPFAAALRRTYTLSG